MGAFKAGLDARLNQHPTPTNPLWGKQPPTVLVADGRGGGGLGARHTEVGLPVGHDAHRALDELLELRHHLRGRRRACKKGMVERKDSGWGKRSLRILAD